MELLGDELAGFEESVKKLEVLSKDLKEVKVKADSSKVERMLSEHLDGEEVLRRERGALFLEIERMVRSATIIPKWMIVLFFLSSAILFMVIGYFGYQFVNIQKLKTAEFKRGKRKTMVHFRAYFDDNPTSLAEYKTWIGKIDSVPKENQ